MRRTIPRTFSIYLDQLERIEALEKQVGARASTIVRDHLLNPALDWYERQIKARTATGASPGVRKGGNRKNPAARS